MRLAVFAVIGVLALVGCSGQIESATNVTQDAATLTARVGCGQEVGAGEAWLEHRPVGATGAWTQVGRRRFSCVAAGSEQRTYRLTGLSAGTSYEARMCSEPDESDQRFCSDTAGTIHEVSGGAATRGDVTYFRFTTATATSSAVTLQEVDGSPGYYGQFTNPLPTSPTFFVVAGWLRPAHEQSMIDQYKDFGMNTFVGLENPEFTNEALIRANGMKAFIQADERTRFNDVGSETAGWLLHDEIDMTEGPGACPSRLTGVKSTLPADGRARYNNYGKGVGGQFSQTDQQAACFVNAQDITSIDVYWFTDPNESHRPESETGYAYGLMVDRVRFLDTFDGKRQPIWNFVELGSPGAGSHRAILPAEIRSAVWHSIIAGARGIIYFDHNFGGTCHSGTIRGSCYPANRAMAKSVNQQIHSLAPVLNAPTVTSGATTDPSIRAMVKWHAGNFYVFAGSKVKTATTGTVNIPCVGNAAATRLGETGSVQVTNGSFSDTFPDKNAVHIYRIDGGSTCGLPGA